MTEQGYFSCTGHTIVITGIHRRDIYSKYEFEVIWKSTDPEDRMVKSAIVSFHTDGTIEDFLKRAG